MFFPDTDDDNGPLFKWFGLHHHSLHISILESSIQGDLQPTSPPISVQLPCGLGWNPTQQRQGRRRFTRANFVLAAPFSPPLWTCLSAAPAPDLLCLGVPAHTVAVWMKEGQASLKECLHRSRSPRLTIPLCRPVTFKAPGCQEASSGRQSQPMQGQDQHI